MDPVQIGIICIFLLLFAILAGFHVGVSLAAVSVIGVWWITGNLDIGLRLMGTTSYRAVMEYIFGVIPMFILMGALANLSGASKELYDSANLLFAKVRGGLGITTVFANAIFAAITGVSVASAAVFTKIAVPEMRRLGYDRRFALGTVAGSSVLGMLIPPSGLLIIYGILSEQAIGRLFMAGVIPGIVMSIVLSLGIYLMVMVKPSLGGKRPEIRNLDRSDIISAIFAPWAVVVLVLIVLGGIYSGVFTPTEAGAMGAFGALILTLVKRKLTLKTFWETLLETGYVTASVFLLLIGAQMYSRMLAISGMAAKFNLFITSLPFPPTIIILMFVLVFILLGAILDSTSILLVCIPLMIPTVQTLGFDLIWFGIVSVVAVEMGLLTPPFGMVIYAMKAVLTDDTTIEDMFRGAFPFLIMIFVVLLIIIAFPWLSTYLPSLM